LNCGIRIPPSAGSASGVLPNPVGHNRVYVHTGPDLTWEAWWAGLRKGRSFVTNGPLLLGRANGELPGHVFRAGAGETISIDLSGRLVSRDPVTRIEVIKNGRVVKTVPVEHLAGKEPFATLTFDRSGWFLLRAIADIEHTFRFASTAPFHVEIGKGGLRISRTSARFFLDWSRERKQFLETRIVDSRRRRNVVVYHDRAESFWKNRVKAANAE
ncbi:MAG: hypothetical protein AAF492_07545, partial [Verrucomicrobiota bacterium]